MRNSDGSEWTEIKTTGILQHSHRVRLIRRGVQINESNLVSLLASEPISEDVLRIETTLPSLPPGTVGYIVPKTRLFINKPKARDIGWDAVTAAGVYVLTGSVSLATGAQMFQRALRMMRVLSADEADIVIVMAALSGVGLTTSPCRSQRFSRHTRKTQPRLRPCSRDFESAVLRSMMATAGASLTEARMFRCATDPIWHGVVGYHDGIDTWTLDLATGIGGSFQSFVSLHERSHQALHETTAWGTAMTVLGLGATAARSGAEGGLWEWMGEGAARHTSNSRRWPR